MELLEELRGKLRSTSTPLTEIAAATKMSEDSIKGFRDDKTSGTPQGISSLAKYFGLSLSPKPARNWLGISSLFVSLMTAGFVGMNYFRGDDESLRVKRKEFRELLISAEETLDGAVKDAPVGKFGVALVTLEGSAGVKATMNFEAARSLAVELDGKLTANDYQVLAVWAYYLTGFHEAESLLLKGLAITESRGDVVAKSSAHGALGELYFSAGDLTQGREHINKAILLLRTIPDTQKTDFLEANTQLLLAENEFQFGDDEAGTKAFETAKIELQGNKSADVWIAGAEKSIEAAKKLKGSKPIVPRRPDFNFGGLKINGQLDPDGLTPSPSP